MTALQRVRSCLVVGGDGQVTGLLKLGHNVLDDEGTHQATAEHLLSGDEDLLGRPVSGVPAIAL